MYGRFLWFSCCHVACFLESVRVNVDPFLCKHFVIYYFHKTWPRHCLFQIWLTFLFTAISATRLVPFRRDGRQKCRLPEPCKTRFPFEIILIPLATNFSRTLLSSYSNSFLLSRTISNQAHNRFLHLFVFPINAFPLSVNVLMNISSDSLPFFVLFRAKRLRSVSEACLLQSNRLGNRFTMRR